jgi:uncharacterized protein (UPF0212 family)
MPKPCIVCKQQPESDIYPVCDRPLCKSVWMMIGGSIVDCRYEIRKCDDMEILDAALANETATKNRTTVTTAIRARRICLAGRANAKKVDRLSVEMGICPHCCQQFSHEDDAVEEWQRCPHCNHEIEDLED